jgi:hypothetical protein
MEAWAESSVVIRRKTRRTLHFSVDFVHLRVLRGWATSLIDKTHLPMLEHSNLRRRGRVVDCGGLENRYTLTGIVGSNPTASAKCINGLEAKSSQDSQRYFKQKRRLTAVLMAIAPELQLNASRNQAPNVRTAVSFQYSDALAVL